MTNTVVAKTNQYCLIDNECVSETVQLVPYVTADGKFSDSDFWVYSTNIRTDSRTVNEMVQLRRDEYLQYSSAKIASFCEGEFFQRPTVDEFQISMYH